MERIKRIHMLILLAASVNYIIVGLYTLHKTDRAKICTECGIVWYYMLMTTGASCLFFIYTCINCVMSWSNVSNRDPNMDKVVAVALVSLVAFGSYVSAIDHPCRNMYMNEFGSLWNGFLVLFFESLILCILHLVFYTVVLCKQRNNATVSVGAGYNLAEE